MTAHRIVFNTTKIFSPFAPSRSVPVRVSFVIGKLWVDFMVFKKFDCQTMVTFENFMLARFEISGDLDMSKRLIAATHCDIAILYHFSNTLLPMLFFSTGLTSLVVPTGNIQFINRCAESHCRHGSICILVETVTSI